MKTRNKTLTVCYIAAITMALFSFDLPNGWHKAGSMPNGYDMGFETIAGKNGRVATIKSNTKKVKNEFGTLMQNSLPDKFLGKRVRMSGVLKTTDVKGWAGFWFRIDDAYNSVLGFDNMKDGKQDRSVIGTNDWTKYEIVLDVPQQATNLAYGALLSGTGQVWFDDITFEPVSTDVATTGMERDITKPQNKLIVQEPTNLDFEK